MDNKTSPSLLEEVEHIKARADSRQRLATLESLSPASVLTLWKALLPFFLRGSFYSLIQIVELLLLIRLDFFAIPLGSLGLLTLLSVGHSAALCLSLSLKRLPKHRLFRSGDKLALIESLICDSTLLFALFSTIAIVALTFRSSLHFSSPPMYRAMTCTWFLALPLEAAILMGLFTARERGVILRRRMITFLQIAQTLLACFAVWVDLPLLYIVSYLVGLVFSIRVIFPFGLFLHRRTASERFVFSSLLARALAPTFSELGGKFLYLPLAYLDPSLAVLALVMQRLMHVASSVALRVADLLQRGFLPFLCFGSRETRILGLRRVSQIYLTALPLLLGITLPFVAVKNFISSWVSPYDEKFTLSVSVAVAFLVLTLFRAYVGLMARLLDEERFSLQRVFRFRSLWTPGIPLGIFALSAGLLIPQTLRHFAPSLRTSELLFLLLGLDALILLMQFLFLRYQMLHFSAVWPRMELPGLLKEEQRPIWLFEVDAGFEHLLDKEAEEAKVNSYAMRIGNRHLLLELPKDESPYERPSAAYSEIYPICLWGSPGEREQSLIRIFQGVYAGRVAKSVKEQESFLKRVRDFAATSAREGISIDSLLQGDRQHLHEDLMRYLDFLLSRGSILPIRSRSKKLRGIFHRNSGLLPSTLFRVEEKDRHNTQRQMYQSFLENVSTAKENH